MYYNGYWFRLFFHWFFFLVCLSSGASASVRQCFSCLSVVLFCRFVSLHAALLFFLPFQLVCSCFRASLPSLRFVSLAKFSCWVFYPLPAFVFGSFTSESRSYSLASVCTFLSVASPSLSVINFSFLFFSFCLHRSSFRCFVSCFVHSGSVCRLVTCFALLCFSFS